MENHEPLRILPQKKFSEFAARLIETEQIGLSKSIESSCYRYEVSPRSIQFVKKMYNLTILSQLYGEYCPHNTTGNGHKVYVSK